MTPTPQPEPDLTALWATALRIHPIYSELAREFVIESPSCPDLEASVGSPGPEAVEQAALWLNEMDDRIQVHQLRQFLQTNAMVDQQGIVALVQHLLGKSEKSASVRDKIDFLLVQYFSLEASTEIDDSEVDLAYVAQALEPILGAVDLQRPVLSSLDRVREAASACASLHELLHGGLLEQGRKAKTQAGEMFYTPAALVAFTRFGYLMRRVFFRLMLGDLHQILAGLDELDAQGIETIDCRRAQFSAQEPVMRLRMICQSWKVMFQAEYSSGQPLRMLVDLRASVEQALGHGTVEEDEVAPAPPAAKAPPAKPVAAKPTAKPGMASATTAKPIPAKPVPASAAHKAVAGPRAAAAAAGAGGGNTSQKSVTVDANEAPEFEVSAAPAEWSAEPAPPGRKK